MSDGISDGAPFGRGGRVLDPYRTPGEVPEGDPVVPPPKPPRPIKERVLEILFNHGGWQIQKKHTPVAHPGMTAEEYSGEKALIDQMPDVLELDLGPTAKLHLYEDGTLKMAGIVLHTTDEERGLLTTFCEEKLEYLKSEAPWRTLASMLGIGKTKRR